MYDNLSVLAPSNVKRKFKEMKQMTPTELAVGFCKLMFLIMYHSAFGVFYLCKRVWAAVMLLMQGPPAEQVYTDGGSSRISNCSLLQYLRNYHNYSIDSIIFSAHDSICISFVYWQTEQKEDKSGPLVPLAIPSLPEITEGEPPPPPSDVKPEGEQWVARLVMCLTESLVEGKCETALARGKVALLKHKIVQW